jgi:FKBP-type peptidyl-prolyl cis-trans isomerase
MKSIKFFVMSAIVALTVASCISSPKVNPQPKGITAADVDTASYTLGVNLAQMTEMYNLGDLDVAQIVKGYKDAVKGKDNFTNETVGMNMNNFMMKRQNVLSELNATEGAAFLAKNKEQEGVQVTQSGLQYKIVRKGNGTFPTAVDQVECRYEGTTLDGKVFDTTYEEDITRTFELARVIAGWTEGIQLIDEGGEIILWIPSELAYGERGPMGPNQVLKFRVELVKVIAAEVENRENK